MCMCVLVFGAYRGVSFVRMFKLVAIYTKNNSGLHRYELSYIYKISERKEIRWWLLWWRITIGRVIKRGRKRVEEMQTKIFRSHCIWICSWKWLSWCIYIFESIAWVCCSKLSLFAVQPQHHSMLKCVHNSVHTRQEPFYRKLVGVWLTDIFNGTDDMLTESNRENRVKLWCEKPTTGNNSQFYRWLYVVWRQ